MNTKLALPYPSTRPVRIKRLKVVSACEECRRRKTKCNGEHPCARCSKSQIECIYKKGEPIQNTIKSIEERLSIIESTLRTIINSDMLVNNKQDQQPKSNSSSSSSSIQHLLNN